jgi:hypothetical protein
MPPLLCLLQPRPRSVDSPPPGDGHLVAEVSQILMCVLCSMVIWMFTLQNRPQSANLPVRLRTLSVPQHMSPNLVMNPKVFHWPSVQQGAEVDDPAFFRPPPGLMLFSCLVFGYCVSSFAHRRHRRDPLQPMVYFIILATVAVVGYGVTADAHLVLLGYLPWATCAAMVISMVGHSLYRRLRPVDREMCDEEKRSEKDSRNLIQCVGMPLDSKVAMTIDDQG